MSPCEIVTKRTNLATLIEHAMTKSPEALTRTLTLTPTPTPTLSLTLILTPTLSLPLTLPLTQVDGPRLLPHHLQRRPLPQPARVLHLDRRTHGGCVVQGQLFLLCVNEKCARPHCVHGVAGREFWEDEREKQ